MFICLDCGEIIKDDDVEYETFCWEEYYGVSGMLQGRHYGTMAKCPYCGSEDIDDYVENDDDEDEE